MRVCIPVATDGQVDPRWGRAARVAVAELRAGSLIAWEEFAVAWDRLHDETTDHLGRRGRPSLRPRLPVARRGWRCIPSTADLVL
jgi:hypothetical protein